ncbi:MAG: flagellin [Pseudobdellovibrionaceae bacterium]
MPIISTNIAAFSSGFHLGKNSRELDRSLSKLASGSRIVRASDDAAGLAVATQLKADVTTLKQAANNIAQGISVLGVADGAVARAQDILNRMKALATQSVSGALDNTSRGFLDTEYQQLIAEVIDIGNNTKFGSTSLIDGNCEMDFQTGVDATDLIYVDIDTIDVRGLSSQVTNVATSGNAVIAASAIDNDIDELSSNRALLGSLLSVFDFNRDIVDSSMENLSAAQSVIMDVDIAAEQTNLVGKQVLMEASIAALSQAHQKSSSLLSLMG